MIRLTDLFVDGVTALLGILKTGARSARSGWYGGIETGSARTGATGVRGQCEDVPTNCDGHFPNMVLDGRALPVTLDHLDCAGPAEGWRSRFEIGRGPLVRLQAVGAWRLLHFKAGFSDRSHPRNRSDSTIAAGD